MRYQSIYLVQYISQLNEFCAVSIPKYKEMTTIANNEDWNRFDCDLNSC